MPLLFSLRLVALCFPLFLMFTDAASAAELPLQRQISAITAPAPALASLLQSLGAPDCRGLASLDDLRESLVTSRGLQGLLDEDGFRMLQESLSIRQPALIIDISCQRAIAAKILQAYDHFLPDTPVETSDAIAIAYFTRGNWRLVQLSTDVAPSPVMDARRAEDDLELAIHMLGASTDAEAATSVLAELEGAASLIAISAKPPENRRLLLDTAIAVGMRHLPASTDNLVRYLLEDLLVQRDLDPAPEDSPAWRQRLRDTQVWLDSQGGWRYAVMAQHLLRNDEGGRQRIAARLKAGAFSSQDCRDFFSAEEGISLLADFRVRNAGWAQRTLQPYCRKTGARQ